MGWPLEKPAASRRLIAGSLVSFELTRIGGSGATLVSTVTGAAKTLFSQPAAQRRPPASQSETEAGRICLA